MSTHADEWHSHVRHGGINSAAALARVDKWQIMERHTLCKKIVRGVILAAKHESRADTEVVSVHRACTVHVMHVLALRLQHNEQFDVVLNVFRRKNFTCFTSCTQASPLEQLLIISLKAEPAAS